MAKTETQINLKINKGNYAKIQENLSQIGENELIIADDINIPLPDELNEGKGIISHNNKYVFEDVQLKNLITDIETHKTENGSYPSTKAVYDYCQTIGIPTITITSPHNSGNLSDDNLTIFQENYFKPMIVIKTITLNTFVILYKVNEDSNYARFSAIGGTGDSTNIISKIMNIGKNNNYFWTYYDMGNLEKQSNKKTSVQDNSSSNTYFPTTKAVYDFVNSFNHIPIINLPQTQNDTLSQDDLTILQNNTDKPILLIANNTQALDGLTIFTKTKTFTENNETYSRFEMVNAYFENNVDYNKVTIIQVIHSSGYWYFLSDRISENLHNKVSTLFEFNQNIDDKHYPSTQAVYQFALNGQEIMVTLSTLDLSQTYTFTLTNDEYNKLRSTYHLRFTFVIDMDNYIDIYVKPQFIFDTTQALAKSSTIVEIDNKQYIALITLNGALQSNNATLSFQEIEGGSGGGTGSSEKIYTYKMEWDSVDVGVGQTNILTFSVNENTIKGLPSVYQNLIDASDLVSAWNTIKAGVSGGSQDAFYQAMVFITMLSSFTFDKSLIEFDDNIDGSMKNITAITAVLGNDQTLEFSYNNNTNSVEHYSMALNDFLSSTITLLGSVGGASNGGGSSTGGGSGKLYELEMQLTRYYANNVIKWGEGYRDVTPLGQTISDNYVTIKVQFYESRFEYIKEVLNPLITTFNTAYQTNIPQISQPSDLVSLLNDNLTQGGFGSLMLYYISQLAEKSLVLIPGTGGFTGIPIYNTIDNFGVLGTFSGSLENDKNFFFDDQYEIEPQNIDDCSFSINNTCVLHEYGSSSGGSGEGSGSGKLYDIKFNLSMYDNSGNDKDFAFQNGGDTSYQVNYGSTLPIELLIYESNFERLKQAFNQNTYLNVNITDINSLVSTINGIDESSYSPSNTSFLLLYALISYCDKAYICPSEIGGQTLPSTPKIPIFCDDFNVMLGALYICYETSTNVLSCKIVDHDSPETVDLNYFSVNNSCTLTEYGTSGGSGEGTAGVEYVHIRFDDIDVRSMDGNEQELGSCDFWVTKERWDVFVEIAHNNLSVDITLDNIATIFPNMSLAQHTAFVGYLMMDYYNGKILPEAYIDIQLGGGISGISIRKYPYRSAITFNGAATQNIEMVASTDFGGFALIDLDKNVDYFISGSSITATLETINIGSSGGSATKKVYAFSLKTSADGNAISTNNYVEMVAKISEDAFNNDFLSYMNQVGQQLAQQQGITWTNINNVNDFITFENTYHSVYGMICMATLVDYCLKDNNIAYAVLEDYSGGDGFIKSYASTLTLATIMPIPLNVLGLNVEGTNSTKYWFDSQNGASTYHLDFSANAISSLTYTEETETISGGSSSSQPTIPERFSLAYNLVVNINQEQFANGSWTGSNSDNIRTFQYNGSNADETKAKELVEFLTGVNVLDSYNATKPTPCFVFCTQSNICWKLQWDNSLLHAYKVENFPFVVKQKYYNFFLRDTDTGLDGVDLEINIPYETMQDVYDSINQVLGGNISTPQEVIAVYDSLKADNISAQSYGMLIQLFNGLARTCLVKNLNNIVVTDGIYKISGVSSSQSILYCGNVPIFSQTLSSKKISFTSSSTLVIHEYDEDKLD